MHPPRGGEAYFRDPVPTGQKLSRDRNYNFFRDRPAEKLDCSRILIISLITFYLVMTGARGKGDDKKKNRPALHNLYLDTIANRVAG